MEQELIIKLAEFDQIVNDNKMSGRHWYYGLKGRWWWGMSEKHARRHVSRLEEKALEKVMEKVIKEEKEKKRLDKAVEESRKRVEEMEESRKRVEEMEESRKREEKEKKKLDRAIEEARKREEKEKKKLEKVIEEARKRAEEVEYARKRAEEMEYARKRAEEMEYARKIVEQEMERISTDKIVLVSTWNVRCGIATYTKYLSNSLIRIMPSSFVINPIIDGELQYKSRGKLTHLQHEFGIVPDPPEKIRGKLIVTWHTVSQHTNDEIKRYESKYDVAAHIVHSDYMLHSIDSSKDVWVIPHGSTLMPQMKKEDAKRILGINIDIPIGFVFGFQSKDKNYERLIDAAKNTDIHLIISGAQHRLGQSLNISNNKNVTFINRFIEENEVNLYALASDILLFDYVGKNHYSVSGALHRIIGAARPVICSDIKHFDDIEHGSDCLKFKNQEGLEKCINNVLENRERFGLAARRYAEKTSWEKMARRHVEIYKKYADF